MRLPLVSVVIPAYNRAVVISRAVRSIQNQTFHDLEIVVVDDGSIDNTVEIVAGLARADHRIRYVTHSFNKGAQAARNMGARAALGKWIAYQDSDDEWLPNSLELRLEEAERSNVKVVHSECYIDYSETNQRVLFGIRPLSGNIYRDLLLNPGPVFPALLVLMSALRHIYYLDETIVSYQEWDTCIRLAKEYEFGFVEKPTFIYYRHTEETISSNSNRSARGYEQIVEKHKNEIISRVGHKALAQHYTVIAKFYASNPKGNYAELTRKYLTLAIKYYPSPRHIYNYLVNFLSAK